MVAVSHPHNRLLWVSRPLIGVIQGTPVVSRSPSYDGQFIFVTCNVESATGVVEGVFSLLSTARNATQLFREGAGFLNPQDRYPYTSLGVSHFPAFGNFPGGAENTNDLVVWMTMVDGGTGRNGYLRAFQIPAQFDTAADDLGTFRLANVSFSAVSKPTLSQNGLDLHVAIRQSQIRGWVRGKQFTDAPNLLTQLRTNASNPADRKFRMLQQIGRVSSHS